MEGLAFLNALLVFALSCNHYDESASEHMWWAF